MSLAAPKLMAHTPADARAGLVNALRAAGLDATTAMPDVPTDSSAWPQWTLTTPAGHLCAPTTFTFSVYAVLPAGDALTTVMAGDDLVTRVWPFLAREADVVGAEPVLITFGDGTSMPGVRFRVTTR